MGNKIYLSGQFGFREDTLENWVSENPVLERGEPAVIRDGGDGEWLKIGDGITAFNDLPYKKGPRGEKGETGPQGPQGEQGVKGEQGEKGADGKDAVTDLHYNPESKNAQSGKAVAEVIDGAVAQITGIVTNINGEIDSLNNQRFAVYYTDKELTNKKGNNWLEFDQAFYGCGYGGVTYGEGTYDNRPKIGDMLICRVNGWIFKVAGIGETNNTICAWFISKGVGDKEYAEKEYVGGVFEDVKNTINNNLIHNSASGESILLTDSSNYAIEGLKVYGKSTQEGTPTPEAPIDIVSAGASGSVEVKVCGANLFSLGEFQFASGGSASGYASAPNEIKEAILSLPNGVYTVVYTPTTATSGATKGTSFGKIAFQDKSSNFIVKATNTFEITDAVKLNTNNIVLYGYVNTTNTVKNLMLNIGSTALPYEPYTEQTLTLATPNELRAVGEYKDYIDLERGVFVQNIYRATEKDFKASVWESTNAVTLISTTAPKPKTGVRKELCNISGTYRESWEPANTIAYHFTQIYSQRLVIVLPVTYTTEEQGQEVLNNGIEFVYILETPIETPLTAEELAYYKALHTNYPNTTIFNSDGTNMDVSYIADTKLYIDNKFAELSAAIINNA